MPADHLHETRRLLTEAADQWELHRFTTGDNETGACDVTGLFNGLLAAVSAYERNHVFDGIRRTGNMDDARSARTH